MKYYRLNYKITSPKVRLIDETGKYIGVLETRQALLLAEEKGLDLIEVDPTQDPPVAKMIDFTQFKYELKKKERDYKTKQKKIELKGIRLTPRIGKHDIEIRLKNTLKFLEEGNKVKIEMIMRGRENMHADMARKIIEEFLQNLGENIKIDQPIKKEGGRFIVIINKK